jgi:hypothetical protein
MGRIWKYAWIVLLTMLAAAPAADAQLFRSRKKAEEAREQAQLAGEIVREDPGVSLHPNSGYLGYRIENKDTVYYDTLDPVWVFPKGFRASKNDMRQYYRLVYNFNKVYPYALAARQLSKRVDTYIADNELRRRNKEQYINSMQKELFNIFEKPLRSMSISQGKLLIKLIDREFGHSSYSIIKDYKSGITAGFWQGVAKLFGQNLKDHYDPKGADQVTEHLVQTWESGHFDALYFSVFMQAPARIQVPSTEEAFARAAARVERDASNTR